jgi:flagellar biosynthesis/type III secretory pathway protein FliH
LVLPKVNDLKELKMSLAERFDEWAKEYEQKGIEKGIEKGIVKGEALVLQRQLVRRFGALSSEVVSQISTATSDQLETWCDRVLDATSLDEVFLP